MSTCTFPPKGHSLIRFLIQVVLPEGRLEYPKVIKTIYMFAIWCFIRIFFHRGGERESNHLDTLDCWQSEDMGLRVMYKTV